METENKHKMIVSSWWHRSVFGIFWEIVYKFCFQFNEKNRSDKNIYTQFSLYPAATNPNTVIMPDSLSPTRLATEEIEVSDQYKADRDLCTKYFDAWTEREQVKITYF